MRFALLGADGESCALARAAVDAGHQLAWCGDLAAAPADAAGWLAGADRGDAWEDLHDAATADGVIVGRGAVSADLRARQVIELARLGRPLVATHPLFDSVLTFFEVDLARSDGGARVDHFNPLVESPVAGALAAWIADGHPTLGAVEQVAAVRSLARRDRDAVLWHFARDVELLDRIAGPLDQLGAHAAGRVRDADSPVDAADYGALAVQLSGARRAPVRWSVEPPTGPPGLVLTLLCEQGRVAATFDEAARNTALAEHAPGRPARVLDEGPNLAAAAAIARFASGGASTWPAALRAMELADTIEIALRRGRVIDVHRQQLTEQLAFKGTMAAAGCAVIGVVAPATLAAGWAAGQLGLPIANFLPHALLALLAGFLGLQLLPWLAGRRAGERSGSPPAPHGRE